MMPDLERPGASAVAGGEALVSAAASTLQRAGGSASFTDFVRTWNELQGLRTPELHEQISWWLHDRWSEGARHLLLMVFRDAGKSTLVGLFCGWLLSTDPDLRIAVLSADQALATKMTRTVRRILERHPATRHLRPRNPEMWAADQLTIERHLTLRDPSLLARGVTGNITGSRADIVICDDVEVPNTCDTSQKREDLRARLSELFFVQVPTGLSLFIGTPHTYKSIYAESTGSDAGGSAPFLAGYDRLVLPVLDEQGRSRWPERFDLDTIERLRRQVGPTRFRSQMLLQPTHDQDIRLDPEALRTYDTPLTSLGEAGCRRLYLGNRRIVASACWWDPAFGRPGRGDSSVVAAMLVDSAGEYWLHGLLYLTISPDDERLDDIATAQCRKVARFARVNAQRSVTIETNGLGKFLPALLRRVLREEALAVAVREHTSTGSKDQRILGMIEPVLAAQQLHVHVDLLRTPFIEEMRDWRPGGGGRDDGLDSVSGCLALLPAITGSTSPRRPVDSTSRGDRSEPER